MSGRKRSSRTVLPWLTARSDGKEGRFIQVGNSLLLDKRVQKLSGNALRLYLCMAMESGGKRHFLFPQAVGKKYGVPLFDLKRDKTRRVDTPLRPMDICCRALDADYLINLPVLKGHCQTAMTCALKNCKGCLPDREKRRFHAEGLMRPIAALAAALRPELTIVDSLCGDLDFEEGGNPVPTGRMLLGEDPVQLDAYGCRLMGLALEQAPYIQMAEAWGAGSTRLEEGDVVRLNEPSAAADYPAPSGAVAALTRTVQARSACSACYASLVRALHTSGVQGLPIAIGQGWRGIPFDGLGIGACCNYAKERVPGCPPPAEDILRVLSARC